VLDVSLRHDSMSMGIGVILLKIIFNQKAQAE